MSSTEFVKVPKSVIEDAIKQLDKIIEKLPRE